MNIQAYRQFLEKSLNKLNEAAAYSDMQPIKIRSYTDEELLSFVKHDLSAARNKAVLTVFPDNQKLSYTAASKILGVSRNYVRQLVVESFASFIKEGSGFRT